MNKYQEAFDTIKKAFKFRDMISAYQYNSFDIIQELIDNYSTMEEQVKTCEHSADKKIEQLEKALDKSCEMICKLTGMKCKDALKEGFINGFKFSDAKTIEVNLES